MRFFGRRPRFFLSFIPLFHYQRLERYFLYNSFLQVIVKLSKLLLYIVDRIRIFSHNIDKSLIFELNVLKLWYMSTNYLDMSWMQSIWRIVTRHIQNESKMLWNLRHSSVLIMINLHFGITRCVKLIVYFTDPNNIVVIVMFVNIMPLTKLPFFSCWK